MPLAKIVSGGQTGVDRGGLDAALAVGFSCGGWSPEGRKAEDAVIPYAYPLVVLPGVSCRERTLKNVHDSDGTLVLYTGQLSGGTKRTRDFCLRAKKPFVILDAAQITPERAVAAILHFIEEDEVCVLNVAGPRGSGWAEGQAFGFAVLRNTIAIVKGKNVV